MDNKTKDEEASSSPEALGYLSRAWDLMSALRLACAILFADMWLTRRTNSGLFALHVSSAEACLQTAGELLAAALVFAVMMSLAVPAACRIFRRIAISLGVTESASPSPNYHNGFVSEPELRKYAQQRGDSMALKIADAHLAEFKASQQHGERIAVLVVSLIATFVMDSPLGIPAEASSLISIAVSFAPWAPPIAMMAAIGAVTLLRHIWQSPATPPAVCYWPAADALAVNDGVFGIRSTRAA